MGQFHKIEALLRKDTGYEKSDTFGSILRIVLARPVSIHQGADPKASAESFSPIAGCHCREPGGSEMPGPSVSIPQKAAQRHSRIVHWREAKRVGGVVFA